LDVCHTWCGPCGPIVRIWNADLKCTARVPEIQDARNRHLGTIAQLYRAVSSQLRHIWTIGKNLLNSKISSTGLYNMAIFGPANFNGFRVLAALMHGTLYIWTSAKLCGDEQRAPPIPIIRQGGHHVGHWPTF